MRIIKLLAVLFIAAWCLLPSATQASEVSLDGMTSDEQELYNAYQGWLQEQELKKQLAEKASKLQGSVQGECVIAVRNFLGVKKTVIQGKAIKNKPNAQTPTLGAIAITKDSKNGHAMAVIDINIQERSMVVYDSNWKWNRRAMVRTVSMDDKNIIGYITINYN